MLSVMEFERLQGRTGNPSRDRLADSEDVDFALDFFSFELLKRLI